MEDAIRKYCDCGSYNFTVYYYEDGTLDYIECSKCGTNIDWETPKYQQLKDKLHRRNMQIKGLKTTLDEFDEDLGITKQHCKHLIALLDCRDTCSKDEINRGLANARDFLKV